MPVATETSPTASFFLQRKENQHKDRALARLESQIANLDQRVDRALAMEFGEVGPWPPAKPEQLRIWGVPFSYLTLADTLQHIDQLIQFGQPEYFITANLNYIMLTEQYPELRRIPEEAGFIVCDGMPMVWRSRCTHRPLPERVAGSELIYALSKWAAIKGHRVFFLGGAPGVARAAADKLVQRYPGLQVAGVECPPFRPLTHEEEADLLARIRDSQPDILYVALGQPKGELWLAKHYRHSGAAVSVQLGASFDFVAGGVARAPLWIQRAGLEWAYRLSQEPHRLARRYGDNARFLGKALVRDLLGCKVSSTS